MASPAACRAHLVLPGGHLARHCSGRPRRSSRRVCRCGYGHHPRGQTGRTVRAPPPNRIL